MTPELVINFRTVFLERRKRLAAALSNALSLDDAEAMLPLTLHIFLHVPGLWTFCFPRPDSLTLLQERTNRHLLIDFKSEMTRFLQWVLSGSGVTR